MLAGMTEPAELLKAARARAGLSGRALAERAGVAYSTVARIELGQVDPTTGMLTKLLAAAGEDLELSTHRTGGPWIGSLVDAWHHDEFEGQDRPDWTRLRAFLDFLELHPESKASATLHMPAPSGSQFMDNLLAGVVEKTCHDAALPVPSWTRRTPPLKQRWYSRSTPRREAAALAATPPELAARNITMTADSLWRYEPATRV